MCCGSNYLQSRKREWKEEKEIRDKRSVWTLLAPNTDSLLPQEESCGVERASEQRLVKAMHGLPLNTHRFPQPGGLLHINKWNPQMWRLWMKSDENTQTHLHCTNSHSISGRHLYIKNCVSNTVLQGSNYHFIPACSPTLPPTDALEGKSSHTVNR